MLGCLCYSESALLFFCVAVYGKRGWGSVLKSAFIEGQLRRVFVVDRCRYLLQQGVKKKKIKTALRLYNM